MFLKLAKKKKAKHFTFSSLSVSHYLDIFPLDKQSTVCLLKLALIFPNSVCNSSFIPAATGNEPIVQSRQVPLEPEIICSLAVLKVIKEHCMFLN
jgi:hypothetical protein